MRQQLSPDDIANSIRMTRSQHRGAFLLVEGKTSDARIFERLIDRENCQLEPAHSRQNVLDVLAILEDEGFPGILGIVDADRSRVSGDVPRSENVLLTDGCDLESMLLHSPALYKVLAELASQEKIGRFEAESGTNVLEHLCFQARAVGALRYVLDRTPRRPEVTAAGLLEEVESIASDLGIPSRDLSNGHDMVGLLAQGLRRALGSRRQISAEVLERELRLAYEGEYFLASELRAAILKWEQRNPAFRILRMKQEPA